MKKFFSRFKFHMAALVLVTAVLCWYVELKEGYHMDELLSFQLSNAEYNPWIVPTQPEGRLAKFVHNEVDGDTLKETLLNVKEVVLDVIRNKGNSRLITYEADVYEEPVWISREQFRDYITVDAKDDFNYLSVYFNVKDDNHPPLHFMLLHTISSVCKGEITPFMGCVINIAAVLGCCILMMLLGRLLDKYQRAIYALEGKDNTEEIGTWERTGIAAAILYGCSAGAIATTLLIRMYGLMTFFCVAIFYLHIKKWQEDSFKKNKLLILVTVLGFLTQYFFLFYCMLLAVVMAALLLFEKRYKSLFCYIRSMVISAVIGICLFPFAISDVFNSGRGVEALENLSSGLSGYGSRLLQFMEILLTGMFGKWENGLIAGICLLIILLAYMKKRIRTGSRLMSTWQRSFAWLFFLPVLGYFLLAARMSPYLVDRYIMPLFPFAMMLCAFVLRNAVDIAGSQMFALMDREKLGVARSSGNLLLAVLILMVCLGNLTGYDGSYLYAGYGQQVRDAEEFRDLPCICVYDGVGYYENLVEFTIYEKTLLVKYEELENRLERESLENLNKVAVIIKSNVDEQKVLTLLEEEYGLMWDGPVSRSFYKKGVHSELIFILEK